ncbi:hypothetical protein BP5796_11752 [Coleophoma crateriformis]|uniref:Uncharacterized protein n=1 Tax=Coleophoma crateriformis TaxID=565419 RepID=A0A3D8QE84_9HELO|nr:hypothetical protein BP5796_11752 [Coleophoma crateriformis]
MYHRHYVFTCGHTKWGAQVRQRSDQEPTVEGGKPTQASRKRVAHPLFTYRLQTTCKECQPIRKLIREMKESVDRLQKRQRTEDEELSRAVKVPKVVVDTSTVAGVRIEFVNPAAPKPHRIVTSPSRLPRSTSKTSTPQPPTSPLKRKAGACSQLPVPKSPKKSVLFASPRNEGKESRIPRKGGLGTPSKGVYTPKGKENASWPEYVF